MRAHFKNLNSLRAIAALLVVVSHIEAYKPIFGFAPFKIFNMICLGTIAVTLFFVLSGFLITFLILEELKIMNGFNLKQFYIRRILRIWPLYFLVLLTGIFLFPLDLNTLLLSLFFLPHLAFIHGKLPSVIDPIWSIGVEEQFYLFFPILFKLRSIKRIFNIVFILIAVFWILKGIIIIFKSSNTIMHSIGDYLYLSRFDSMLIGALGAIWHYNKINNTFRILLSIDFICKKQFQYLVYSALGCYLILSVTGHAMVIHQLYSLLFIIIIINLATNSNSVLNIENKMLNYLGKISYGLYLTHNFSLNAALNFTKDMHINNYVLQNICVYISAIALSILIAAILFHSFESLFLKYKNTFSPIKQI